MQSPSAYKKTVVYVFLFIALCALCTSLYIAHVQKSYVSALRSRIADEQATLTSLSKMVTTDNADAQTGKIITDCSIADRERFDALLGKLSTLGSSQLSEIANLFNECGSFYPIRSAVVVAKLQRELEIYIQYITLLSLADTKIDTALFNVESWQNLVALQSKKSELSLELVAIQGRIIHALLAHTPIHDAGMQALLREGQDTKDLLLVASQQATDAEAKLHGL